jgi:hypothetical protein
MVNPTYGQYQGFVSQYGSGAAGVDNYAAQVLAANPNATLGDFYSGYVLGTGNPAVLPGAGALQSSYPSAYNNLANNSGVPLDTPLASLTGGGTFDPVIDNPEYSQGFNTFIVPGSDQSLDPTGAFAQSDIGTGPSVFGAVTGTGAGTIAGPTGIPGLSGIGAGSVAATAGTGSLSINLGLQQGIVGWLNSVTQSVKTGFGKIGNVAVRLAIVGFAVLLLLMALWAVIEPRVGGAIEKAAPAALLAA